ncbi:hypothetical protein [Nannocystis radixulma]|uniref:Uncharacterized protein n=1 Tax=Nannocystis radixulma TaxID=2995305 RepID=A0ABT5BLS2_9BACT|nr:hypothetical protein [Nannocystis radixulma]MDC0673896.1 hypothetical protein [Nannocystis radixulma]
MSFVPCTEGHPAMSRYVRLDLGARELARADLLAALGELGLQTEVAEIPGGLMLEGNFECAGEPVDLRLPAGALAAVADFGLRAEGSTFILVCGEHDRALLSERLVAPLGRALAAARVRAAATAAGLDVDTTQAADGTLRLRVRPPA